jgi:hypothetical protein
MFKRAAAKQKRQHQMLIPSCELLPAVLVIGLTQLCSREFPPSKNRDHIKGS